MKITRFHGLTGTTKLAQWFYSIEKNTEAHAMIVKKGIKIKNVQCGRLCYIKIGKQKVFLCLSPDLSPNSVRDKKHYQLVSLPRNSFMPILDIVRNTFVVNAFNALEMIIHLTQTGESYDYLEAHDASAISCPVFLSRSGTARRLGVKKELLRASR